MKSFELRKSAIHGNGIFALENITANKELFQTHVMDGPAFANVWVNMKPNCSYNHSKVNANCISSTRGKFKFLLSVRDIKKGEELLADYTKDKDLEQPQEGWVE